MNDLTRDYLWNLLRLAEDYADRCEEGEVVRNGHVIESLPLFTRNAPDVVVGLIRYYRQH